MASPAKTERHAARLRFLGRDDRVATLEVVVRDRPARIRRALVGLAATWGCAIAAVFLPVLHFILVPALLLGGPFVALQRLSERVTVLEVRGDCPGCGTPQRQVLNTPARTGIEFRCESCRRAIGVELPDELLKRS